MSTVTPAANVFTGVPTAPTPVANTNTTQVATTAFVVTNNKFSLAVSCSGVKQ